MNEIVKIDEVMLHNLYKQIAIATALLESLIDPEGLGHSSKREVFHAIKDCLDRIEALK